MNICYNICFICLIVLSLDKNLGILGFFFQFKSLQMISPTTVATLRTTEVIIAYFANIMITRAVPEVLNICGTILVLFAAISVTFEKEISDRMSSISFFSKYDKLDMSNNLINEQ